MFEVGWTEMLVIAIVMIVVVGPKDLPNMLRTFGRTVAKLRAMAGDFQKQFNEALKEAELDDVKKSVDALRGLNPASEIRKQLNPFEQAAADVRSGIDNVMKPKPAPDPSAPASAEATPAEPLKNGATEMPAAMETPVAAEAAKAAAPVKATTAKKAAKPAAEKATPAKAAPAKAAPAKAAPAKAVSARPAAAKPASAKAAPVKVSAKAAAKPVPAPTKKPATAKKKTAGTAK
ncbi:MAG: Sec-independent protein translocase protein TatB [Mesorhizobium sp.]